MRNRVLFGATVMTGLMAAGVAAAQVTPSDVRDLVGARAAGGESELAARGYVNTGGRTGDGRKWTYWWNERRGVCCRWRRRTGDTPRWSRRRRGLRPGRRAWGRRAWRSGR